MLVRTTAAMARCWAVLGLSVALASGNVSAADEQAFAREATDLLTRLGVRAREFKRNAEALNELAFRPDTRPALVHKTRLNMLKEDAAKMGELSARLDRNRGTEEDWQVQLVDRILPKIQSLRAGLDQALGLLDRTTQPLWAPHYQSAVGDIRDQANGLVRSIDVFLKWAEERERVSVR